MQVKATRKETVQPAAPPLHRSTRVKPLQQPWSPSNTSRYTEVCHVAQENEACTQREYIDRNNQVIIFTHM